MIVRQKMYRTFIIWSIISGLTIGIPMIVIDSTYYGKLTFAPLNIIAYNVFTSHGPNLYGTEPLSFYLLNGIVNFNVIWLLALITPILLVLGYFLPTRSRPTRYLPYYVSLAPLYIWLLVFFLQPHKEERFLFPIYFLISLCGAVSLDICQKLFFRLKCCFVSCTSSGTHYLDHSAWISATGIIFTALVGLSKSYAIYHNYHAPLDLMMELNTYYQAPESKIQLNHTYNVCVGKDWYRFPNSFFLPSSQFRVCFLKSEFNGILPAYFDESENGSTIVHPYFNDLNQANAAMYTNYEDCDFLLDLDTEVYTELEPNYEAFTKDWQILRRIPFINSAESNLFLRSFYVPIVSKAYNVYYNFNLFKRRK